MARRNEMTAQHAPSADATGSPGAEAAPLLEMKAISKDFAGGRVLYDVDLTVEAGQVHGLVGANGAGKSTLMKILAGVHPDYHGTVLLRGKEVRMRNPRAALQHGIAVIYQEFTLVPDLTVAENIALGREDRATRLGGLSHRDIRERSEREARSVGIDLPMDARVSDLSVAGQQLTEIVKAVARDVRVLVMDEPTARLSGRERDHLFALIGRLCDQGVGIVYVSHFLEEIFTITTRVTVLRDGYRVACEPTANLDLTTLAKLMVGDKYQEIEHKTVPRRGDETRTSALRLRGVAVKDTVQPTDFDVPRGQVVGLAGLAGSGRTELARAIVGAMPGATGVIETDHWRGLPKSPRQAAAEGILMLPADRKNDGLLTVRPVSENIELTAMSGRLSRVGLFRVRESKRLVTEMLHRFSVHPRSPDVMARSLSGGNQQKVIFARAVAAEPSVLILDQPTAGVDIGAKVELYDLVDSLTADGVGVLLISDDLTELLRLSDHIVFMRNGVASEPRPASGFDRVRLLEAINSG